MEKDDAINTVSSMLLKLTWNRVFLAFGAVVVYTIYENRDRVFPLALNSPTLMGIIGVSLFITAVTGAIRSLVLRTFLQYETRLAQQGHDCEKRLQQMEDRLGDLSKTNDRLARDVMECRIEYAAAIRISLARIEERLGVK